MSTDRPLPELPIEAFRNHATPERVERVWQRLEAHSPVGRTRHRSFLWWAPAAALAVFGLGVFVGAHSFSSGPMKIGPEQINPSGPTLPRPEPPEDQDEPEKRETRNSPEPRNRSGPAPHPEVLEIVPGPEIAPAPPVPVPPGPPEWQRLANLGEFDNAWQALEKEGGFDAALAAASPEQIMLLVEIARFTRNRGRALQALRQLIKLHPDSPQAQDAAWVLANMLEQAGDRAGAAEAFALYQRLSPKGDLFEDSVVRQVELAIEQRDLDKARRLAEEHARKYPDSARLAEIRLGLERLAAAQEGIEDIELLPSDESEKLE